MADLNKKNRLLVVNKDRSCIEEAPFGDKGSYDTQESINAGDIGEALIARLSDNARSMQVNTDNANEVEEIEEIEEIAGIDDVDRCLKQVELQKQIFFKIVSVISLPAFFMLMLTVCMLIYRWFVFTYLLELENTLFSRLSEDNAQSLRVMLYFISAIFLLICTHHALGLSKIVAPQIQSLLQSFQSYFFPEDTKTEN